jgi:pimeloyl-ACP methyl ester carboxylesterase
MTSPGVTEFRHAQVRTEGSSLHVVEAGDPAAAPVVLLHGWPQSWRSWRAVMELASQQVRAIAIDLPGIGKSAGGPADGSKRQLADTVHQVITGLGLRGATLVGHDVGGMITYAYLRNHDDLARAVIMDVVVPGLGPWEQVIRNPYLWHFAFHSIPALPELLVQGRQAEYFNYFYEVLSPDPAKIIEEARAAYVTAHASDSALTAGFSWYRAFGQDAIDNRQPGRPGRVSAPLLYLRGEHEGGDISAYVAGFRDAGLTLVSQDVVPGAGHFAPEEQPAETWRLIWSFLGR